MRRNVVRTIQMLMLALFVMPAGMLFAIQTHQSFGLSSSHANWYDTEQATNLLSQMQNLAFKTRKEVARLQVQDTNLNWQAQTDRLAAAKRDVNKMGNDLVKLNQMKQHVEPWQQSLIGKVTPRVHELVYQMDAALRTINRHQNKNALALTEYPQNINMIYHQANQMASTIGTVTQYVHAEQNLAELEHSTSKASS